ncbi:MAG TPA: hypothetical protein VFQ80_03155 [Thermomicrobiales bacterium]|nr:hypothetical protein [Thermomicrobiales bacterium]
MGRSLVPATMLAGLLALAIAAATLTLTGLHPAWWPAAVALAILGGLTPMIFAVTIRVVPVFSRRQWRSEAALRLQVGLMIVGAWTLYAGRLRLDDALVLAGSLLALAGGIAATANTLLLFQQPAVATMPAPPADPSQLAADRVARPFTRLASGYLLFGLGVGVVAALWRPPFGRWELVWAHALLIGYVLSMASGISYHVLGRWTGRPWPWAAPLRVHLWLVQYGLPVMIAALAIGSTPLFAVAGVLEAAAILLFLVNTAPMLPGLPAPTRPAFMAASALFAVGIALGGAFALDPALGARLRPVHAELNLFGWAGLLVSGAAYFLAPRFAGKPLRWPRLAYAQIGLLGGGVILGAAADVWRLLAAGPAWPATIGHALMAAGFLALAAVIGGTFFGQPAGQTIGVAPSLRPARPT